ncbi:calcium-binding protein e63-1-like [Dermatophagoides farinae]|uniref:Calcium-binding protein e63-1-like n=3 Tax=Dermatophagoides farinae TaxID=6954 RepID=A0A9D4P3N6_DERFA|nr:calcium-binding protein e63-1-like [Dermatophagoides farinae]
MKKAMSSKSSSKSSTTGSMHKSKYKKIDDGQLKCAFAMFDTNHDGKLNSDEMKHMMTSIGVAVSDRMLQKIFKEASKSGDQLINEQDFLHWFSRFKTPKDDDAEADLKAAFLVFDKDKNGYITRDELKSAMLMMDESITERDLDELLKTTDHDRDGKINYEEFIKTLL